MTNNIETLIPMHSYDGALPFIYNVKVAYPHLRLVFSSGAGVLITEFKSESELTGFILKCDTFRGLYA